MFIAYSKSNNAQWYEREFTADINGVSPSRLRKLSNVRRCSCNIEQSSRRRRILIARIRFSRSSYLHEDQIVESFGFERIERVVVVELRLPSCVDDDEFVDDCCMSWFRNCWPFDDDDVDVVVVIDDDVLAFNMAFAAAPVVNGV